MQIEYLIVEIGYIIWIGLGFFRGINSYEYNLNVLLKYNKNKRYMYLDSFGYGIYGLLIYTIPVFLPILIYKELYRLEINIRNLENEKNSQYYDLL